MSLFDRAFEAHITEAPDGSIVLHHRFLFWGDQAEIDPSADRIVLTKRGLFSTNRQEGSLSDVLIRIETEDMGGPSYQLRFGCAAALMLGDQRFVLTRQYGVQYVEEYLQQISDRIGRGFEVERLV